jgi:ATP-dependent DNA ligase
MLISVLPKIDTRLLYVDSLAARGCDLYRVACERDLEGIVGKWARGTYQMDGRRTSWLKIKNPEYSQIVDRHELFAQADEGRRRSSLSTKLELALG